MTIAISKPPDRVAAAATGNAEPGNMLLAATTAALWMSALTIGIVGHGILYPKPIVPAPSLPPIVAEQVQVELDDQPAPKVESFADAPPVESAAPSVAAAPAPPDLPAVAAPSASLAFSVPVEGPVRLVDPNLAGATHGGSGLQRLVLGVGEGAQPDPEYPRDALIAGQQGKVSVRFTVGEDGRVTSTTLAEPSRWPLLNQAATRVIQERWKFAPGPKRAYVVTLEFKLQ